MILGSLWGGDVRQVKCHSEALQIASTLLSRPIVALCSPHDVGKDIRGYLPREIMLPDLSLADVLAEELHIETEDRSLVLLISPNLDLGRQNALLCVAEGLYAAILAEEPVNFWAIFVWSLRSLGLEIGASEADCNRLIADFAGAPADLSAEALGDYITLIEPSFSERCPDPLLVDALAAAKSRAAWVWTLRLTFGVAIPLGQIYKANS